MEWIKNTQEKKNLEYTRHNHITQHREHLSPYRNRYVITQTVSHTGITPEQLATTFRECKNMIHHSVHGQIGQKAHFHEHVNLLCTHQSNVYTCVHFINASILKDICVKRTEECISVRQNTNVF